ncbi:MAG TPA: hypothetical protein VFQ45_03800 [Longimicrobium sp.]|nr:hypothetical protein [Longimicrobium sp.]
MPTTVYTGADGSIAVAVEAGPSGDKAGEIAERYSLTPVGRVTGVTVRVTNDVRPFHELGQRFATELRPGNLNVYGTIERAFINGALLRLMLGDAADNRPQGAFVSPSFNLSLRLQNPVVPDASASVSVMGVQLSEWRFAIPEDEFVMEGVSFRALWVKTEETG